MLCTEIIAVCCQIHTKHVNTAVLVDQSATANHNGVFIT